MVVSMVRILLGLVVIVALPGPAEATTYYTDKAGSNANSCATAATAASNRMLAKLTIGGTGGSGGGSCVTAAGDMLIVGDGTYVEGEISLTASGASGNPITIQAEHLHLAILSSTSSNPSCAPNISFNASWLVIDGIRGQIDATDPAGCPANSANGAFVRMWGSNNPQMGGNESTGYQGGVVRNCYVVDHTNRSVGIKTNQDYSLIENCTMENSLEGFNGINQVFRNNTITGGDAFGGAYFTCKGGARNCQFYNNVLVWASAYIGIGLGGNSSCCWWDASTHYECYNCVAYNNVVRVTAGTANYAIDFIGCKSCTGSNNVIVGAGKIAMEQGSQGGFPPQPWPDLSVLKNTILSGTGIGCSTSWGSGTNTTTDYNEFYNCTSAPSQTHAITGDPLFVDSSADWHLQVGSPALESGTTVTAVTYAGGDLDLSRDVVGTTRVSPWDLGIYEDDVQSTSGGPIMFISLGWILFGIAIMAGSALAVNGIQQISAKVPRLCRACLSRSRTWGRRIALRVGWASLIWGSRSTPAAKRRTRVPVHDANRE